MGNNTGRQKAWKSSLFIGTFGQPKLWDIHQEVSYQHPMVPYDVLVDPQSIPTHPILSENITLTEVIQEDPSECEDDDKNEDGYEINCIKETENMTVRDVT